MTAERMVAELRTDLAVRWHGRSPTDAPTLFLLHGLTGSGSAWPDAVARWDQHFAILSVDQRGHGTSPRFTEEQLAGHPGDVMVVDALGILEQLPEPPVVTGHSLGGAVALCAAVRRPELVSALVLEDPAPRLAQQPQRDQARGAELLEGVMESLAAVDHDALLEVGRKRHPTWSEAELAGAGAAECAMDLPYLRNGEFRPSETWRELFTAVTVPTLVVSGDDLAEVCITEALERGIAEIGNAAVTLVRVPGSAHCVRREQPDAFHAVVDPFLLRQTRGPSG